MIVKKIKCGHLSPITCTIKKTDGTPYDLTTYDEVRFVMANQDGTTKQNAVATFVDKPNGKVRYDFVSNDVSTVGIFRSYFTFKTSGVPLEALPIDYFEIHINENFL